MNRAESTIRGTRCTYGCWQHDGINLDRGAEKKKRKRKKKMISLGGGFREIGGL